MSSVSYDYLQTLVNYVKMRLPHYSHLTPTAILRDEDTRLRIAIALDEKARDLQQRILAVEVAIGRQLKGAEVKLYLDRARLYPETIRFFQSSGIQPEKTMRYVPKTQEYRGRRSVTHQEPSIK